MRATIHWFLIGTLAGISPGAFAQIFECIDSAGNREFTQKCAPGTVRQREVATVEEATPAAAKPPPPSYKEQDRAYRERQTAREVAERKERSAAEASRKKCTAARAHLVSIENARRVRGEADPQTGERHFLDDTERAAATQKARDAVAASCK